MNIIAWAVVIIWMVIIFYLSHQPATDSQKLSNGITGIVEKSVKKITPNLDFEIDHLHHLVRKNAHFFIYLVLGILVINALRLSGWYGFPAAGLALLTCCLYAISDEFNQLYIPGKGAQVNDVVIDTAGSTVGIGLYILVVNLVNRLF